MEKLGIDLGFVEDVEQAWRLHRAYFPSKMGGKPAWLDPKSLPSGQNIICQLCSKPLVFLLQIYAPDDENLHCFHRTVFVFCCKNGSCYKYPGNGGILVLRCCLTRRNQFYHFDSPDYDSPQTAEICKNFKMLCNVCGFVADKACSRCKRTHYCGKEHQILDWKYHKKICSNNSSAIKESTCCNYLFPEKEIVIEPEDAERKAEEKPVTSSSSEDSARADSIDTTFSVADLEEAALSQEEDKAFVRFKKKISHYPDQVLRYDRGGKPLWCSSEHVPNEDDIPRCACGAERQFEFQIMPQLIHFLNVESTVEDPAIDWGTMAVYTCSADCTASSGEERAYKTEFCWRQNYSHS